MIGSNGMMKGIALKTYVFRLLGSIYEEDVGEQESHPTVIKIKVSAPSEKEAEQIIGNGLKELAVAVETIRMQKEAKEAKKQLAESYGQPGQASIAEPTWRTTTGNNIKLNADKDAVTITHMKKAAEKLKDNGR